MPGAVAVMVIIIGLNLLVVLGVMYFGTRGHHESEVAAAQSPAVAAMSGLIKPVAVETSEEPNQEPATEADESAE